MSMTREGAIERLSEQYNLCKCLYECSADPQKSYSDVPKFMEALGMALIALRPVSREKVERVWRGEWIDAHPGTSSCKCTKCGAVQEYESTFCCHCGAPMTDEAVEMVVKRMEVLNDAD